ncbi:MAG: phosphatidylglycerol lysyltransferase domain-containing protein [Chryseolinea sp.]
MFRLTKSFFNRSFFQVVTGAVFLMFLIYFIRNEHVDIANIQATISTSNMTWIVIGVAATTMYLVLQALLYVFSFKAIGITISLNHALRLFLKRNFISTFLPAGTFTSLAFFSDELDPYKLEKTRVHYGSFLFALASMISIVFVAIPALSILLFHHNVRFLELEATVFLISLVVLVAYVTYSLVKQQGWAFRIMSKFSPALVTQIGELKSQSFSIHIFCQACFISVIIEAVGVAHLFIAMKALDLDASIEASFVGYVLMIIILSISPFLRGLGAIEVSLTYVLTLYGYPAVKAASVTLLFRLFEFWLPFFVSASVFLIKPGNLLLRVLPAIFILLMGVVNTVSALTPAIPERLHLLRDFIPFSITEFSNVAVLLMGIGLIIISAFLLTGARNAWQGAIVVSALSLVGHLTKAFDYEEAIVALVCLGTLWYTRNAYFVKFNISFNEKGIQKVALLVLALLTYSIGGFYWLRMRHLEFDFTIGESIKAALQSMVFITGKLTPHTKTGHFFLYSIQYGSIMLCIYVCYLLYRGTKRKTITPAEEEAYSTAVSILDKFGQSSIDYFKLSFEKQFFFNASKDAFLSYAESKHYMVVLENPVAPDEVSRAALLSDFETFAKHRGLRTFYYRVTEEDLFVYRSMKKQAILLGQEAIVDLRNFTLEGGARKSIRNALRKIETGGYHLKILDAPLKDGIVQQLKTVSAEWLSQDGHAEAGFSQGIFDESEIKKCTVLTLQNQEEKIFAFISLIPGYKPGEATYDLIRKTGDAPNGTLDYLLIKVMEYFKSKNYSSLNMGLAPMAGLRGSNVNELVLRFYRDHSKQASNFKGLYEYKSKFDPTWENRYLIYDQTFDLVRFPSVLELVSGKP